MKTNVTKAYTAFQKGNNSAYNTAYNKCPHVLDDIYGKNDFCTLWGRFLNFLLECI